MLIRRPRPARGFRDAFERVGHGAHEFDYAFTGGGGDGMKFEAALRAEGAQFFKMRVVRGGVELGGDHDHRLFRERWAERSEFVLDDFEIAHGIAIVRVARVHQMRDQPRAFDVLQKANAQPGAFVRAFDEAGKVGDNKRAAVARAASGSAETTPRCGSSVVNG